VNLEDRVAALEQAVVQLNDRLTMGAGLAAGRDRDLSDLVVTVRSHTSMLQAVQERLAEHTGRLAEHTGRLDRIDGRLDRIDGRLDTVAAGQQTIVAMLTTLIDRSS
jgi:hypothetical protein